jgi:predicted transcriptional regulator
MTDRVADFLGTTPEERESISRTVIALIDLKARITHGDMTYFDITRPENVVLVREQEDMLRAVLQKILQKDKMIQIFSQVRERDAYFDQRLGPPVSQGPRGHRS